MSDSSIWPIYKILSSATTLGQSGPRNNVNEGVLHIPQRSRIGALPSDSLVSYPGHSSAESYLTVEIQLVYFIAPAFTVFIIFQSMNLNPDKTLIQQYKIL